MGHLKKIDLSRVEQETQCAMGEKIQVSHPEISVKLKLSDLALYKGKDQYLDYDQAKGYTFVVPTCPCTGYNYLSRGPITVDSPKKYQELQDSIYHAAWMEIAVCSLPNSPSDQGPPTTPLPPTLPVQPNPGTGDGVEEQGGFGGIQGSVSSALTHSVSAGMKVFLNQMASGEVLPSASQAFTAASIQIGEMLSAGQDRSDCEDFWDEDRCEGYDLPTE